MKNFTVKVPGTDFELSSNQIYHIREVSDTDAPDGFQQKGISKHPLPGIAQGITVPYSEATRTWNTGFFKESACYQSEGQNRDNILKQIQANLLPELQALVDGDLVNGKANNNEFFDEFTPFNGSGYGDADPKYKIKGGNVFNTKHPLEFLAIWWALIGKQIMPPSEKDKPEYRGCSFVIEDNQKSTSLNQDKEFDKSMAISTVMGVMQNKKDKKEVKHLQNLFTYAGFLADVDNTETKPLIATFSSWCEKGGYNNENSRDFNEVVEKFSDEKSREELIAYVKLIKDIKSSKVKVERQDIMIEGQNLGSDKKIAARKIVADQELYKAFLLL